MPAANGVARNFKATDFPLLVKFIFPKDKLSIQVHPDDAYAAAHEPRPAAAAKPRCGMSFRRSPVPDCSRA